MISTKQSFVVVRMILLCILVALSSSVAVAAAQEPLKSVVRELKKRSIVKIKQNDKLKKLNKKPHLRNGEKKLL